MRIQDDKKCPLGMLQLAVSDVIACLINKRF
jgi:hypothetical protein